MIFCTHLFPCLTSLNQRFGRPVDSDYGFSPISWCSYLHVRSYLPVSFEWLRAAHGVFGMTLSLEVKNCISAIRLDKFDHSPFDQIQMKQIVSHRAFTVILKVFTRVWSKIWDLLTIGMHVDQWYPCAILTTESEFSPIESSHPLQGWLVFMSLAWLLQLITLGQRYPAQRCDTNIADLRCTCGLK